MDSVSISLMVLLVIVTPSEKVGPKIISKIIHNLRAQDIKLLMKNLRLSRSLQYLESQNRTDSVAGTDVRTFDEL